MKKDGKAKDWITSDISWDEKYSPHPKSNPVDWKKVKKQIEKNVSERKNGQRSRAKQA